MTHGGRDPRTRLTRSWSSAVGVLIVLAGLIATTVGLTAAAAAQSPSPADGTDATRNGSGGASAASDIVAAGPFGRVPGISLAPGSLPPDPATLDALDAYGRGAKVILTPADGSFDGWQVTAAREEAGELGTAEGLATGASDSSAAFRLRTSGLFLVRLDATPIGATDDHTISLGSGSGATSTNQLWFSAPPRGRWVILVHVRFDRDRGTADGYGRLILE